MSASHVFILYFILFDEIVGFSNFSYFCRLEKKHINLFINMNKRETTLVPLFHWLWIVLKLPTCSHASLIVTRCGRWNNQRSGIFLHFLALQVFILSCCVFLFMLNLLIDFLGQFSKAQ